MAVFTHLLPPQGRALTRPKLISDLFTKKRSAAEEEAVLNYFIPLLSSTNLDEVNQALMELAGTLYRGSLSTENKVRVIDAVAQLIGTDTGNHEYQVIDEATGDITSIFDSYDLRCAPLKFLGDFRGHGPEVDQRLIDVLTATALNDPSSIMRGSIVAHTSRFIQGFVTEKDKSAQIDAAHAPHVIKLCNMLHTATLDLDMDVCKIAYREIKQLDACVWRLPKNMLGRRLAKSFAFALKADNLDLRCSALSILPPLLKYGVKDTATTQSLADIYLDLYEPPTPPQDELQELIQKRLGDTASSQFSDMIGLRNRLREDQFIRLKNTFLKNIQRPSGDGANSALIHVVSLTYNKILDADDITIVMQALQKKTGADIHDTVDVLFPVMIFGQDIIKAEDTKKGLDIILDTLRQAAPDDDWLKQRLAHGIAAYIAENQDVDYTLYGKKQKIPDDYEVDPYKAEIFCQHIENYINRLDQSKTKTQDRIDMIAPLATALTGMMAIAPISYEGSTLQMTHVGNHLCRNLVVITPLSFEFELAAHDDNVRPLFGNDGLVPLFITESEIALARAGGKKKLNNFRTFAAALCATPGVRETLQRQLLPTSAMALLPPQ